jgi:NADH:ubiquinone oxidoreductase subunit F (NADH-binding)
MTAILHRPVAAGVPVGWIGEPRLLREIRDRDLVRYAEHLQCHGPLPTLNRQALLSNLDAVGLNGRGGAGFPLAAKVRSLRSGADPFVVVNGAEGEPASAKDHVLLSMTPHQVLDGAALIAHAIGARKIFVAVADPQLAAVVQAALLGRPDAARFELRRVQDRFIAGEARALISSLNGTGGLPPGRRVLPTDRGVAGQPTLLSNAETFAHVACVARLGPERFGDIGVPGEPGSTLLTVTGAVRSPGVIEAPYGVQLGVVAEAVGAEAAQAVIIGGYHGAWLSPDPQLPLSSTGLATAGGTLGAGSVIFLGQRSCGLAELARVTQWLADESAKQCGPCAFGLPALAADVRTLATGASAAGASVAVAERHAAMIAARGACAHPDGAARFVRSGLVALAAEVDAHQADGGCRRSDLGHLPLSRAAAFGGR